MPGAGTIRPPVELWVELEARCNLHCGFCYNYWRDGSVAHPRHHGAGELIEGLTRLLERVDCRQLALSGGEPLLYRELDQVLLALQAFAVPLVLTTNGSLLTPERLRMLLRLGVTCYQVSLHSHRPAVHDRLVGGRPSWTRALAALAAVLDAGSDATVVFVATRLNLHDFPRVVAICGDLGIRAVIFNRFIPTGLGASNVDTLGVPAESELWDALTAAHELAVRHEVLIHLGVPLARAPHVPACTHIVSASCPVHDGQRRWTIGADLGIRRCNHSAASIGSLMDGGLEKLLAELRKPPPRHCGSHVHPCHFLEKGSEHAERIIHELAPVGM